MQTNTTYISAVLRGDQRSKRFTYRHSVAGAAREISIPVSWIWFWLFANRLKSKIWLRKVWVRLESVLALSADPRAVRDASYATGEFLTSAEAILVAIEREQHPHVKFQLPRVKAPESAKADVSDPVIREEVA